MTMKLGKQNKKIKQKNYEYVVNKERNKDIFKKYEKQSLHSKQKEMYLFKNKYTLYIYIYILLFLVACFAETFLEKEFILARVVSWLHCFLAKFQR